MGLSINPLNFSHCDGTEDQSTVAQCYVSRALLFSVLWEALLDLLDHRDISKTVIQI